MMSDTLTAEQAIEKLKVKAATLYSYVSRGLIRTQPDSTDPRRRLYLAADIERLSQRRAGGQKTEESTPPQSIPSLFEALGEDALKWAKHETFERAVTRLWQTPTGVDALFGQVLNPIPPESVGLPTLPALMTALAAESAYDVRAYDFSLPGIAFTGARILRLMTDVLINGAMGGRIAERLATAWRGDSRTFDAVLILLADESPVMMDSTVRAVRYMATPPYASVLTGIALLTGATQAGQSAAAGLLREVGVPERAYAVVARRLRHNFSIAGFQVAPVEFLDGERRTGAILDLARAAYPDGAAVWDAVIEAARYAANARPTLGFALAALEVGGRLPEGAGLGLLALGRAAAWLRPMVSY